MFFRCARPRNENDGSHPIPWFRGGSPSHNTTRHNTRLILRLRSRARETRARPFHSSAQHDAVDVARCHVACVGLATQYHLQASTSRPRGQELELEEKWQAQHAFSDELVPSPHQRQTWPGDQTTTTSKEGGLSVSDRQRRSRGNGHEWWHMQRHVRRAGAPGGGVPPRRIRSPASCAVGTRGEEKGFCRSEEIRWSVCEIL